MREPRRSLFLGAAIAGIALVVGFRAAEQIRHPGALTARGEKLWFGWAYPDPALLGRLENAESLLRPGEAFCVDLNSSRVPPAWLQAMTNYAFWREVPAGPCPGAPGGAANLVRIAVSEKGDVAVVREPAR